MEGKDQYSEDYWKGVADALTLVENFLYWRSAHPNKSRDPLEFVHECLKEVRKKIGPSLVEILGVSFEKEESEEENIPSVTTPPVIETPAPKTEPPTAPEPPTPVKEEEDLTVVPIEEGEEEEETLFSDVEPNSTEEETNETKSDTDDENPFV
ncbi:MAG: hypothetical protein J7L47_01035 [Candidatus Odinarchaeota archaeon]|nr:hypothetical protein [Candidatus Odinarchaeota archaeon]